MIAGAARATDRFGSGSRSSTWRSLGPPIDGLGVLLSMRDRVGSAQHLGPRCAAEHPQVLRSLLVAVDEVIELELIDRASVKLGEAIPNVLQKGAQLALVVRSDCRAGLLAPSLVVGR